METESTLSSYHIFNAVAEAGNLSKAAKMLYISQPAISRAVSKLEQKLSVKLFIRNSRGVHLTEEGRLLYEHTKSAFDALRQGEENLRRINSLGAGQLRIGSDATLCKHILMPCLQNFIKNYPHIQITVQCHSTSEVLQLLEEGKLDIGLIDKTSGLHTLEFLPVTELEYTFVATEAYINNLKIRESEKMQPENGQILDINNMDLLIDFSKIGLGIGCVIKEFVQNELEEHTLLEVPLPNKPSKHQVGFAYNKTSLQAASVNKFINFYKGGTR